MAVHILGFIAILALVYPVFPQDISAPVLLQSTPAAFLGRSSNGEIIPQILITEGETVTWTIRASSPENVRIKNNGLVTDTFTQTDLNCEEPTQNTYSTSGDCTVTYTWTPSKRDYIMTHIATTQAFTTDVHGEKFHAESTDLTIYISVRLQSDPGCTVYFTKGLEYTGGCVAAQTWWSSCIYDIEANEYCDTASSGTMTCTDNKWTEPACINDPSNWGSTPTPRPTPNPTYSPTLPPSPTNNPTVATIAPSRGPTESGKTYAPTLTPTVITGAPSGSPTGSPSQTPTVATTAPSAAPSRSPTMGPDRTGLDPSRVKIFFAEDWDDVFKSNEAMEQMKTRVWRETFKFTGVQLKDISVSFEDLGDTTLQLEVKFWPRSNADDMDFEAQNFLTQYNLDPRPVLPSVSRWFGHEENTPEFFQKGVEDYDDQAPQEEEEEEVEEEPESNAMMYIIIGAGSAGLILFFIGFYCWNENQKKMKRKLAIKRHVVRSHTHGHGHGGHGHGHGHGNGHGNHYGSKRYSPKVAHHEAEKIRPPSDDEDDDDGSSSSDSESGWRKKKIRGE